MRDVLLLVPADPDVVVIGAGVVGAACALAAARAGLRVLVVDRGPVAGGTTGAGEGNLLVSDKPPGPELDLALLSLQLWSEVDEHVREVTGGGFELERKGGLVVATDPAAVPALSALAAQQRGAGVEAVEVPAADLGEHEPHLARDLAGGVLYPQDAQVQPMLAAARLLQAARRHGAGVRTGVSVTGMLMDGDRVAGVRTAEGDVPAGAVVNAAGTWGGEVAALAGVHLPVLPRRGVVLVTQPLPPMVRHKVYAAEYVSDVASDEAGLESSAVVEGTRAGTVLVGASRERVGFERAMPLAVVRRLAAQAVRLFPVLADVALLRSYAGFRPYCPDHLPVIGPDPRAPGLLHACGHEGAGVGLAAATGHLLARVLTGSEPDAELAAFRPERFAGVPA
jgi:glycine/D-amino acid oxidase-like deaminating enzyme